MLQFGLTMDTRRRNLISARKLARLSQERFAAQLGVNRVTLARWELGETDPSLTMALKIAQVLGFRVEQLFGDEPLFTPEEVERGAEQARTLIANVTKNRARAAVTAEPMTAQGGTREQQRKS